MTRILSLAVLIVALAVSAASAADFVLVVNPGNAQGSITTQEAQALFLGKKTTWGNGQKVMVYTQSDSSIHAAFIEDVIGKTPQQYEAFWKKALFTGQGIPPSNLEGDGAVKRAVAAQPGAVGYISASALDGSVKALDIR